MNCPHCAGRDVGRIGPEHYFCWDCCVEFERRQDGWEIFLVDDEGQLVPIADAAGAEASGRAGVFGGRLSAISSRGGGLRPGSRAVAGGGAVGR